MINLKEVRALTKSFPSKKDVMQHTPDKGVVTMLKFFEKKQIETCFDRFDAQTPNCGYGLAGVCCKACHMGPCKITPKSPRGTCGANEDVIASRNILRWLAGGVSSHGARSREIILNLKRVANNKDESKIIGKQRLINVSKAFEIFDEKKSISELAKEVCDILLSDLSAPFSDEFKTIKAFAPKDRIQLWKSLEIIPISTYHEVFEAMHRTGVGTDGDWQNLMKQMLRCGLAFSFGSVMGGSIAMDILYGMPNISEVDTNFNSLKPDYVNIAVHGHSPTLVHSIVELSRDENFIQKAKNNGAKGIKIYGICCSGLSANYRQGDVSPLSNAMGAELVLGTGALDAWVVDVQDIYPTIMDVAKCFHTKVITTNDSARLPEAIHIGFDHYHSNLDEIPKLAGQILDIAIENRINRVQGNIFIPQTSIKAEIGFSIESLFEKFGGSINMLEKIKSGQIKGVVNLVGCNNPKVMYEKTVCDVADYLLENNILILTNGCASFPLLKLGYCTQDAKSKCGKSLAKVVSDIKIPPVLHFGECLDNARASGLFKGLSDLANLKTKQMPLAFSSPEWSNEKGVGASLGFRLMGFNSYHCVEPPISGSENLSKYFYEDTNNIIDAKMIINRDPLELAKTIVKDIEFRRKNINWD